MGTLSQEIKFEREAWNGEAIADLYTLCDDETLSVYKNAVETNAYLLLGIFINDERAGTVLAKVARYNSETAFVALEVAGKGLSVPNIVYPIMMGFAKHYECDKFVIGASRPAMIKYCEENGFKSIYQEFEKSVEEFFNE